jgi:hypothetical protein
MGAIMNRTNMILALTVTFTALYTHRSGAQTSDFSFRFDQPTARTIDLSYPAGGRPSRSYTAQMMALEGFDSKIASAAGSRTPGRGEATGPELRLAEPEETTEFHPNLLALYLGGTAPTDESTHFTIGLDYVRRELAWKGFGFGAFGEFVFAENTEFLTGVTLNYYPGKHIELEIGGGLKLVESRTYPLLRLGAGYEFEVNKLALTPKIYVDFRDHTAFGFGIAIGKGF